MALVGATRIIFRVARYIVFHANHTIAMVVMGDSRRHHHNKADEQKETEYVWLDLHRFYFVGAKIALFR
jgi:hypothetical protein